MAFETRRRGLDAREDLRQSAADAATRSAISPERRQHQAGSWAAQRLRKIGQKNVLTRETGDLLRAADAAEQQRQAREQQQKQFEDMQAFRAKQLDRLLKMDEWTMGRTAEQDKYKRERDIIADKRYEDMTALEKARYDELQKRKMAEQKAKRERDLRDYERTLVAQGVDPEVAAARVNQERQKDKIGEIQQIEAGYQEAAKAIPGLGSALGMAEGVADTLTGGMVSKGRSALEAAKGAPVQPLKPAEKKLTLMDNLKLQSAVTPESLEKYDKTKNPRDLKLIKTAKDPKFNAALAREMREKIEMAEKELATLSDPEAYERANEEGYIDLFGLLTTPGGIAHKKAVAKAQADLTAAKGVYDQLLLQGLGAGTATPSGTKPAAGTATPAAGTAAPSTTTGGASIDQVQETPGRFEVETVPASAIQQASRVKSPDTRYIQIGSEGGDGLTNKYGGLDAYREMNDRGVAGAPEDPRNRAVGLGTAPSAIDEYMRDEYRTDLAGRKQAVAMDAQAEIERARKESMAIREAERAKHPERRTALGTAEAGKAGKPAEEVAGKPPTQPPIVRTPEGAPDTDAAVDVLSVDNLYTMVTAPEDQKDMDTAKAVVDTLKKNPEKNAVKLYKLYLKMQGREGELEDAEKDAADRYMKEIGGVQTEDKGVNWLERGLLNVAGAFEPSGDVRETYEFAPGRKISPKTVANIARSNDVDWDEYVLADRAKKVMAGRNPQALRQLEAWIDKQLETYNAPSVKSRNPKKSKKGKK